MSTYICSTFKRGFLLWITQDVVPKSVEITKFSTSLMAALLVIAGLIEGVYGLGKLITEATLPYSAYIDQNSPLASKISEADFSSLSWWLFGNQQTELSLIVIAHGLLVAIIAAMVILAFRRMWNLGTKGDKE